MTPTWRPWPRVVTTFYKDYDELLSVRGKFYKLSQSGCSLQDEDHLREAVRIVQIWKDRGGPIPHAILSTAELTRAAMSDTESELAVLICAQAFSNFVTGYTDTQQNSKRKISMFDLSKRIGLPRHFVSMRHGIVHGERPTLIELRRAVYEALKWLWQDYWSNLDEAETRLEIPAKQVRKIAAGSGHGKNGIISTDSAMASLNPESKELKLSESIKSILRGYIDSITPIDSNLSYSDPTFVYPEKAARRAVKKLKKTGGLSEPTVIVDSLLSEDCLLPSGPSQGTPMDMISCWSPLLFALSTSATEFPECLVLKATASLASIPLEDSEESLQSHVAWYIKALFVCVTTKPEFFRSLRSFPIEQVLSTCLSRPGPFTTALALELYDSPFYKNTGCTFKQEALTELSALAGKVHRARTKEMSPGASPSSTKRHEASLSRDQQSPNDQEANERTVS